MGDEVNIGGWNEGRDCTATYRLNQVNEAYPSELVEEADKKIETFFGNQVIIEKPMKIAVKPRDDELRWIAENGLSEKQYELLPGKSNYGA